MLPFKDVILDGAVIGIYPSYPSNLLFMTKTLFISLILCPIFGFSQVLSNNTSISITKTWTQKPGGYTYPISISVPSGSVPQGGFPVCILLHGNGSQNLGNLAGPSMIGQSQFGSVLQNHILIAPTGFENSWNICSENSDAPDIEMINDLVTILQTYANVNPTKIRILGTSNGAGLANRIFIENTNKGIDIVCAIVSHLNDFQYHLGNFYKPGGTTTATNAYCGYNLVASPLTTRKYLSISNSNDPLIPYLGGPSNVGANFLPAETAAFNIASYKGYKGNIISSGKVTGITPNEITEYSYLSGEAVHIKGNAGHQANATQKNYIKDYFSNAGTTVSTTDKKLTNIIAYPNPANNIINLKANKSLIGEVYKLNDNLGRTLLLGKINSENASIDINNLSKGVYYLILGGNFKQIVKIIKK